jgi:eukaryotic-like serine/threonine-protein kinase
MLLQSFRAFYQCEGAREALYLRALLRRGRRRSTKDHRDPGAATQTYPKIWDNWVNLGGTYSSLGDFQKADDAVRKSLALIPEDAIAQQNLIVNLTALGKLSEAREVADAGLKTESAEAPQLRQVLIALYFLLGDSNGVQAQMNWAAGKPEEYLFMASLASVREFAGRDREARDLYRRAVDDTQQQKLPDVSASFLLQEAEGRAIAGMCEDVPALVKDALGLDKSKVTIRNTGLRAALCGEAKSVLPLLEGLAKKYPNDTLTNTLFLPQTRAADDLADHRPEQALRDLESMGAYNLISQQEYLRGLSYFELKDGINAAEAFRKVTTNPGAALASSQDYPQAQLGLARALVLQGNTAGAKQAYHDFFTTWKDADPDLPQRTQAKAEFSALK